MPPGSATIRVTNLSHEKEIILRKRNNETTCVVGHIIPSSIQDPLKVLKVSRQSATLSSAPNTRKPECNADNELVSPTHHPAYYGHRTTKI